MASYNNPAFAGEVNGEATNEISTSNQTSGPAESQAPPQKYKPSCCTIFWIVMASVGLVMNIAMLAGGYQAMFDAIFKDKMELKEGSQTFEMWQTTPFPLLMYLYFYNITNPEEYQQGGKIKLQEVGPIVYAEYHQKKNISFHDNNKTVSFMQERWWIYDDEKSVVKEDDIITALNTIPISAAYSNRWSDIMLEGLAGNIEDVGEELFMNVKAGDLLFYGFSTPLLDLMGEFMDPDNIPPLPPIPGWLQNYLESHNKTLPTIDEIFAELFPPGLLEYDKFGWFYGRNHSVTFDGHWNMYTGADGLENLGIVGTWQGKNTTDFFPAPCNKMIGSAGELFTPNLQKDFIQFFTPDLCMSVKLYYEKEFTEENGLHVYRYIADDRTFSNGSTWPENECYCVKGTCAPKGLVNAESCRYGSPSFISYPHFYLADPWASHNVEGVNEPDPEKDLFYMDFIPEMGVPAHVAVKMQINMHVQPYKGTTYCKKMILGKPVGLHKGPCVDGKGEEVVLGKIEMFENITDGLVPLIWFEETADVPAEFVGQLKMLMFIIKTPVTTIIFSVSLVISALILVVCSYIIYSGKKKAREAAF